jgi:phage shock protein A
MTILKGKLHEALRAANVPEGLAREAAEEAATGYSKLEKGLDAVRLEIADVRLEMEKGFANVRQKVSVLRTETKGELRRLEWMLGALIAIALAMGTRYFLHG